MNPKNTLAALRRGGVPGGRAKSTRCPPALAIQVGDFRALINFKGEIVASSEPPPLWELGVARGRGQGAP